MSWSLKFDEPITLAKGKSLRTLPEHSAPNSRLPEHHMPTAKMHASKILAEFEQAKAELVGKAVVLTGGKAGTVEHLWLDDLHGLRLSVRGHDGKWPVSTIKFVQTG
jgi:hypothetical protein